MDKAKSAVSDLLGKAGHHDTSVHEKVAPAVTHEHHHPHMHEQATKAVDREIHQDHYHTSVQPVHDREVLPEKHSHKMDAVEHRTHHHGGPDAKAVAADVEAKLQAEAQQFKNHRDVHDVKHTYEQAGTVQGEHVHHHVHEKIQPVIEKETIQPEVVHHTIPVHETHHNKPQHHTTSSLPPVSLQDFKSQGGVLSGREERHDGFKGEPRSVAGALSGNGSHHVNPYKDEHHTSSGEFNRHTPGSHGEGYAAGGPVGGGSTYDRNTAGAGYGNGHTGANSAYNTTATTGSHKPTIGEKINPRKDADRDGRTGIMD